jgi:hypothetical protein
VRADRARHDPRLLRVPAQPEQPPGRRQNPDHIRAAFRDHVIYDAILTPLLSHDRDAMLAAHLPATQAAADQRAPTRPRSSATASSWPRRS